MIYDPRWVEDAGWFTKHPGRQHYARLMDDCSTCIVRLEHHHARQHPVFFRVYGLLMFQDPEPQSEAECADAWARLAGVSLRERGDGEEEDREEAGAARRPEGQAAPDDQGRAKR